MSGCHGFVTVSDTGTSRRFRAPASTANLGPGFDCAAAALDLWNELVVEANGAEPTVVVDGEGADELPRDETHLSLRAFALLAPTEGLRFRFVNRIPLERGLGASAAAVALGLVAGAAVAGRSPAADELLGAGLPLEGHADNLAAALHGGVCLAWRDGSRARAARIADDLPLRPLLAVPPERTPTARSRASLPARVAHADAAATAGAAARLGAAVAAGDAELLRSAFADALHEPYRRGEAPLLAELDGLGAGVTLSGSGPAVVVWAEPERAGDVAALVARAAPAGTRVLPLAVAGRGAGPA
jgi:homoserine kinase